MEGAGYVFRAEWRRALRGAVALALVLGLAVGVAIAAVAGARRSASALPRLVAQTDSDVVEVAPDQGSQSEITHEAILELPGVLGGGRLGGLAAGVTAPGQEFDPEQSDVAWALDGIVGTSLGRLRIASGRMLDLDAADEVVIDQGVADRTGLDIGDTATVWYISTEQVEALDDDSPEPEPLEFSATVVGIGDASLDLADVRTASSGDGGRVFFSPAFVAELAPFEVYWGGIYRLPPGVDAEQFVDRVHALAPGEEALIRESHAVTDRFQRIMRPRAVALAIFGLLTFAAALLFCSLTLVRATGDAVADRRLAAAVGLTRRATAGVDGLHALVVAVGGSLLAVVVAVALSPLAPLAPAHQLEPSPGVDVDLAVFAGAIALVLVVLAGSTAVVSWRARDARSDDLRRARRSQVVAALAAVGAGPAPILGANLAFERHGRTTASNRAVLGIVAIATGGAIAALCFGGSLAAFVDHRDAHGVGFDAIVLTDPQDAGIEEDPELAITDFRDAVIDLGEDLTRRDGVTGVSTLMSGTADVGARALSVYGIGILSGGATPVLLSGRVPTGPDEAVVGLRTLDRTGVAIGDELEVGPRQVHVVGTAMFPGFGEYGDTTDMGDAVWMTPEGLDTLGAAYTATELLVDVQEGADPTDLGELPDIVETIDTTDHRSNEVDNLRDIRTTPRLLAVVVGVLGIVALGHGLVQGARRRRPTFATLAALGCTPRQLRWAVHWQGALVALAGLLVGIPLGVAAGRLAWTSVVERIGGRSDPVTMGLGIGAVVLAALVAAQLLSAMPARVAARSRQTGASATA